jgi:hypothetical protein
MVDASSPLVVPSGTTTPFDISLMLPTTMIKMTQCA